MNNLFQEILEQIFVQLTHVNYKSIIEVCRSFYILAHKVHPNAHVKFANAVLTILLKHPHKGNKWLEAQAPGYAHGSVRWRELVYLHDTIGMVDIGLAGTYTLSPCHLGQILEIYGSNILIPKCFISDQNLETYPDLKWPINDISSQASLDFINTHPSFTWNWESINLRSDLTDDFIQRNIDKLVDFQKYFVDIEEVLAEPTKHGDYLTSGIIPLDRVDDLAKVDKYHYMLDNNNIPIDIRMRLYGECNYNFEPIVGTLSYAELSNHPILLNILRSGYDNGSWGMNASLDDLHNHWDEIGDQSLIMYNKNITTGFILDHYNTDEIFEFYFGYGNRLLDLSKIILDVALANKTHSVSELVIEMFVKWESPDWETVCRYDIKWNWEKLSTYIDYDIIMDNQDKPWNMDIVMTYNHTRPWPLHINYKFEPVI